jgi:iron complex outermembrane receptor protein
VINGFGYNRVLTLLDGQRQEEFQWGDEHGVLIDPYKCMMPKLSGGRLRFNMDPMPLPVSLISKHSPAPENGTITGQLAVRVPEQ